MPSSLLRETVCISDFIWDLVSNVSVENRSSFHLLCRCHAIPKGFDLNMGYRHFTSVAEGFKKKGLAKNACGKVKGEVSDEKSDDGLSKTWVSSKLKHTEEDKVMSRAPKLKTKRKNVGNVESVRKERGGSGAKKPSYDTKEKPKLSVSKLKTKVRKGSKVEPVANEAGGSGFLKINKQLNNNRENKINLSIDRLKRTENNKSSVNDVKEEDVGRNSEEKHMRKSYGSAKKRNDADTTALDVGKGTGKERKRKHDDNEKLDDKPKKKKRAIKIDPYDLSNKRLDDSIALEGTTKEKKNDPEKKSEMSKNAQFRAIRPSPSILSFVEDNLLGRRRLIEFKRAGYNIELSAPLDNIPFSTSTERERIEENIFRNKLEFFAAAKVSSSFPSPDLPEIAFAGRSNVGKSSLLNALTRQWGVARTSDKPGLTQTINFFKLGKKLCLVDLPGYGFAYAKEEVKENWEELVKEYVSTRAGLRRVCLLIDTKWGMKPRDHELIELMERSQTKYQIVQTKTDVVFPIDVARRAMQIEENLKAYKSLVQPVMMVSSKTGAGIRSLRTVLAKIARFAKL